MAETYDTFATSNKAVCFSSGHLVKTNHQRNATSLKQGHTHTQRKRDRNTEYYHSRMHNALQHVIVGDSQRLKPNEVTCEMFC